MEEWRTGVPPVEVWGSPCGLSCRDGRPRPSSRAALGSFRSRRPFPPYPDGHCQL